MPQAGLDVSTYLKASAAQQALRIRYQLVRE